MVFNDTMPPRDDATMRRIDYPALAFLLFNSGRTYVSTRTRTHVRTRAYAINAASGAACASVIETIYSYYASCLLKP
jgi:hypothetical protein